MTRTKEGHASSSLIVGCNEDPKIFFGPKPGFSQKKKLVREGNVRERERRERVVLDDLGFFLFDSPLVSNDMEITLKIIFLQKF